VAYSDLQEFLKRLEAAEKLHWIQQPVDPSWEVAAVTRHVFDRYGWNDRPALGFRRAGKSEMPLVVGVIGGSPEIYALALSTTGYGGPRTGEYRLDTGLCNPSGTGAGGAAKKRMVGPVGSSLDSDP